MLAHCARNTEEGGRAPFPRQDAGEQDLNDARGLGGRAGSRAGLSGCK